jgi:transglutaminase-like putative cysteine protease
MLFVVKHTTEYSYSRPVFLEPHVFRLRPRSDGTQELIRFKMQIEPQPTGTTECTDLAGNASLYAWFAGTTERLRVLTTFKVATLRRNPFDYIVTYPFAETLPVEYADEIKPVLSPYRSDSQAPENVGRFAALLAAEADRQTTSFLTVLTRRICDTCEYIIREEGDPQPAEMTLSSRRGSCRDLAVLFIEACRSQGIAARFVSGYHKGGPRPGKRYLHAWAEVYLPGGGWRGYDPSQGLAVSDQHVALAVGYVPALAAPMAGSFRGAGVSARMRAEIAMRTE